MIQMSFYRFSSYLLSDNPLLRVLMDNFTPDQYERFEAYRRHALPKQAVRKVGLSFACGICTQLFTELQLIQQTLGQQVSAPVAQIVAGFSKVFVGEMVEKGLRISSNIRDLFADFLFSSSRGSSTSRGAWSPLA